MDMKKAILNERPTVEQLEAELSRVKYRQRYRGVLKSTVYTLIAVAAVAVLVATLWLPVLQTYGSSMTPTLRDGEIVFSLKTSDLEQGDIIAFYYNNKILIKWVIAGPGDWVDISPEDGNVFVNNVLLEEPYLEEKSFGDADIELPFQVPDGKVFVMGDHRPHLWIPDIRLSVAWRRSRLWAKSCSVFGRWTGSADFDTGKRGNAEDASAKGAMSGVSQIPVSCPEPAAGTQFLIQWRTHIDSVQHVLFAV